MPSFNDCLKVSLPSFKQSLKEATSRADKYQTFNGNTTRKFPYKGSDDLAKDITDGNEENKRVTSFVADGNCVVNGESLTEIEMVLLEKQPTTNGIVE